MNSLKRGVKILSSPISTNTFSQFAVKVTTSFSGLLIIFLISYFLGFNSFGSFSKVVAFISFFYLIIDFGANSIFLRDYFERVKDKFHLLIILRLVVSFFLFLIIIATTYFLPYNSLSNTGFSDLEKLGIIIFGLTLFSQSIIISLNALFQKNLQYKKTVIPALISSIILVFFVSLSVYSKSLSFLFSSYVVSGGVIIVLLVYSLGKISKSEITLEGFTEFSKKIIVTSLPLGLMLFFNLVYAKADTIILSFMRPTVEVGIYGFSYRVFEFALAIPTFFSNSAYPILIEAEKNKNVFFKKIISYCTSLLIISILIMVSFMLFSPMLGFIKKDFQLSVLPIRILSLSFPFFFVTSLLQWILVLKKKMRYLLFVYIFSLALNIILNLIFIPRFSYIASSIITVVCEGVVAVLLIAYLLFYKQKLFR